MERKQTPPLQRQSVFHPWLKLQEISFLSLENILQ